jgi:hypothetical protein
MGPAGPALTAIPGLSGHVISSTGVEKSIEELDDSLYELGDSGFIAWTSGISSDTYQVTGGKFQINRAGRGKILGREVTWEAGQQTGVLSAYATHHIYIDSSGVLRSSTTYPANTIRLYLVHFDGTAYCVSKENHPYGFDTQASGYLHNSINTTIRGSGALVWRVSLGTGSAGSDREVKIVGADTLDDHGLSTAIPDSADAGVTWRQMRTNASGKWIVDVVQTQIQIAYNNGGVTTPLDAVNAFAVARLFVAKDDVNSSTPVYFSVMDTEVFSSVAEAQSAIGAGDVADHSLELKTMELAQLGYAILAYSATGGYIHSLYIAKSAFLPPLIGANASQSHALFTDLEFSASGHTGFAPEGYAQQFLLMGA